MNISYTIRRLAWLEYCSMYIGGLVIVVLLPLSALYTLCFGSGQDKKTLLIAVPILLVVAFISIKAGRSGMRRTSAQSKQ